MKKLLQRWSDSLHISWVIAWKDIIDAFKNRATRINIIVLLGLVGFFYWGLTLRPFDKDIEMVVYDQGNSELDLDRTKLGDGSVLIFSEASSLEEMKRKMRYEEAGLVLPADLDQTLASTGEITISGYILWGRRSQVVELESTYSAQLTELLGRPVQVRIEEDFVLPTPNSSGAASTAGFHILLAVLWIGISVVPHLIFEENKAKTLDALLVSPATAGQVVLGKAMAGAFYIALAGGLAVLLNRAYVIHWSLVLLGFACSALFSIALALAIGAFVQTPVQFALATQPIVFLLIVPAFFAHDPNLAAGVKTVISWLPATALSHLIGLGMSSPAPLNQLGRDLAVSLSSTFLVYALVVWKMRRADR